MELRQLVSDRERQIFSACLAEARATRGIGFKETKISMMGKAHIQFGNLYALFEEQGDLAEKMVGGFITHNLATFPQSVPKPDVSHLDPRYVLEGGELWSLSRGMGRIAHHVAAAVAGLLQAKAIIVYPMIEPDDLTTPHLGLGFVPACERVRWPYLETLDGREIWAQPLILQGAALDRYIGAGFDFLFHAHAGERPMLTFDKAIATQGPRREQTASTPTVDEKVLSTTRIAPEEHNGAGVH